MGPEQTDSLACFHCTNELTLQCSCVFIIVGTDTRQTILVQSKPRPGEQLSLDDYLNVLSNQMHKDLEGASHLDKQQHIQVLKLYQSFCLTPGSGNT